MAFGRKQLFAGVAASLLLGGSLLATGCGKSGGGGSSSPSSGSAAITGKVYQDGSVRIASRTTLERVLLALEREVGDLVISEAHASIDTTGAAPIGGVLVEAILNGSVVASTTTDSSGKFEIGGLAPGTYTLRFTKGADLLITTTVTAKEGVITEVDGKIVSSNGTTRLAMDIEKDHDGHVEHKESEKNGSSPDDSHDDHKDGQNNDGHNNDSHSDNDHKKLLR